MQRETDVNINDCLLADQYRFRKALATIKQKSTDANHRANAEKLQAQMEASASAVRKRRAALPTVTLAPGLPISEKRDLIADALSRNQIIIVAGETGSGKTTQLPKICLQLGYGAKGLIGHTQPRRLAARSVAARIAEELQQTLGKGVGYQVRFTDETDSSTFIKLMTDGILLAEIQQDRLLNKYEVLIIDEAHERSLNIDFLLGYLKRLADKRKELKIIVTSATIDVEKFSTHFNDAPIVTVSGRSFPVDIIYQEPSDSEQEEGAGNDDLLSAAVVSAIHRIEDSERHQRKAAGDILVFLSGEREIRDLAQELRKQQLRNTEVLPLYARLSQAEQKRIFANHSGRRIILSTNVAETSLTVPGIIYVIDTGLARISRYSVQSKVQRLPIERISQASANQRAGRCGRIASGICIRLYSEEDFNSRPAFTEPEIQRTNLSAVILQMLLLNLGDIADFPFVERPDLRAINDGYALLQELGAIDKERRLTDAGRKMARLPADPRLSCMLVEAEVRHCLHEMLIIVSALSVQDPREFPPDKKEAARQKHKLFSYPDSDFLGWVRLWTEYETKRQDLSQGALKQYCKENYLSFMRMREWRETHRQLTLSCQQLNFRSHRANTKGNPPADAGNNTIDNDTIDNKLSENYEAIHRAIVRGSLNQLGMKSPDNNYLGARGKKFVLVAASALYRKMPKWIVTAELIETHRLFASMAAKIEPEWAAEAATQLVKREHFEAHWEKKRGQVVAFEKVTLFGLVLIERQRVDFSKVDAQASHDIFLREALVGEQLESNATFYRDNLALIAEIRLQEEKQRRPDILVSDDQLVAFYASRIPSSICDVRSFDKWRKKAEADNPALLKMRTEDLLQRPLDENVATEYPDHARIGENRLRINYRFTPGSTEDGASIDIPLAMLNRVTELELEWVVPGLVKERCIALIKALPKAARKQFIPVSEFVTDALTGVEPGTQNLISILSQRAVRKGILLESGVWQQLAANSDAIPPYLRPKIRILNNNNTELACSDSLHWLRQKFAGELQAASSAVTQKHPLERQGLKEWNFGTLPAEVELDQGIKLIRYPALHDEGESVAIKLLASAADAKVQNRQGIFRLLLLRTVQQKNAITRSMQQLDKRLVLKLPVGISNAGSDALQTIYTEAFDLQTIMPRDAQAFEALLQTGKGNLIPCCETLCRLLEETYDLHFQLSRRIATLQNSPYNYACVDIREQLHNLIFPGFLMATPWHWLVQMPRFLRAINLRLEKIAQNSAKDREALNAIRQLEESYQKMRKSNNPALEEFVWLLQELRVSLFAQTLKTSRPVSVQRLQKLLASN